MCRLQARAYEPAGLGKPYGSSNWERRPPERIPGIPTRDLALTVSDERYVAQSVGNGQCGVPDMNHEGRAANTRAVGVARLNAQVFGDLDAGEPAAQRGREDPVHVTECQAGVAQRITGSFCLKLDGRLIWDDPDLVGLVNADDRDLA